MRRLLLVEPRKRRSEMNSEEFEQKLLKEFPNLYVDMYGDMRHTCMAWGVNVEAGWHDIIYDLSKKLEEIILAMPADQRKQFRASQVKEKYGTLRFYMTSETAEMSALINEAEAKSEVTCEFCGADGSISEIGGWVKTLCSSCRK